MGFRDYSMNFKSDRVSDFIAEQLPLFVRMGGEDFVAFIEAYYRFLESKILEVIVSSEESIYGDVSVGQTVASVHCLMQADDKSYLGEGTSSLPLLELSAFRMYEYIMDSDPGYIIGESLVEKYANNELTGATGEVLGFDTTSNTLKITAPEGFFSNTNIVWGLESNVYATILETDHDLVRPSKITGIALGSVDLDNETEGELIPRKNLIVNHISGSIEKFLQSDVAGELFNKDLLDAISETDASLPTIYNFTEVETPIYAMNNMFNFGDIDYAFNNQLFLGADYYALMQKEIMDNWPQRFASPTEEISKAIVGRNIRDFYKAKGTEDSIKFIFRALYGEEATIYKPSEKIQELNSGIWSIDYELVVEKDSEEDILLAENRVIYSTANTAHYAYIETVTEDGDNAVLNLSSVFGDFEFGNSISGTLVSGETFTCPIVTSLVQTSRYASSKSLLNGGEQAPVPGGHSSWDEDGMEALALDVVDLDSADKIQDSDYYQLFSYVVRSNVDESEYPQLKETIKNLAHPAGFKLFLENL